MGKLYQELIRQEVQLKSLLDDLKSIRIPQVKGRLRITHKRGKPAYYQEICIKTADRSKENKKMEKASVYIRKNEMDKAKLLAQKDYNEKLYIAVTKQLEQLQTIKHFCENYNENSLEQVFAKMHPSRQELIRPLVLDEEMFVQKWSEQEYIRKQFPEDAAEITTENGEHVRSKSEKIIADKYFKLGIPYRYESQLVLYDAGKSIPIYPDFTVLNRTTRKEYYHEHFGMMDSEEYCRKAMKRVELYAKNGIFAGERLIITHETSDRPMNMSYFESLIQKYLLGQD